MIKKNLSLHELTKAMLDLLGETKGVEFGYALLSTVALDIADLAESKDLLVNYGQYSLRRYWHVSVKSTSVSRTISFLNHMNEEGKPKFLAHFKIKWSVDGNWSIQSLNLPD